MPVRPTFSVVIPVYNRAATVREAIDSVIAQSYRASEIIVVDDGSTDDTAAALAGFEDKIRSLTQENKGPGPARNLGMRHAAGEYVAFLDSDDIWLPWALELLARAVEEYDRPAVVGGLSFDTAKFSGQPDLSDQRPDRARVTYWPDLFTARRLVSLSACAIHRDALSSIQGFADFRTNGEDIDFFMQLGTARGYAIVEEPRIHVKRWSDDNLSAVAELNLGACRFLLDRERSGIYSGNETQRKERMRIILGLYRYFAYWYLGYGARRMAWRFYWPAALLDMRWHGPRFVVGFPIRVMRTACEPFLRRLMT